MKKLTAGIFTVLIGLCAANSADAAIASKAWVEQYAVGATSYATDKSTLESSITDAKKAGTDAATALGEYKTENDAAVQANTDEISAIKNETTGILKQAKDYTDALANGQVTTNKNDIATLQENLQKVQGGQLTLGTDAVDTGNIKANAVTEEKLSTELASKVNAAQTAQQVTTAITSALADYTTTTDLQTNYLTKTDASTTYQTIGNKLTTTDTTSITDSNKDTLYPTVGRTAQMINELSTNVTTNIDSLNTALNTLSGNVGTLSQTVADNKTAAENADKAINEKIGTVTEGKTVVEMIAEAQSNATYDDTAVKADIAANAASIKTINEGAVMTSGIDAGKVAQIETNKTDIAANAKAIADEEARAKAAEAANATAAADAKSAADAAQATANAAIPAPTGTCAEPTNKCVLTYNNSVYEWEVIERADNE